MGKSYWKDIWRTVKNEKKRFVSIAVIAALGVTMMCGLRASCVDLRYSADAFFDEQKLFDIRVVSTLGLTEQDLDALRNVEGVSEVDGGYSETVYTLSDGVKESIEVHTLSEHGFHQPYLVEGALPENENEIAITEHFQIETGKNVGDEIVLEDEPENLKHSTYQISGIVIDALDINSMEGSMAFRSTAMTDYVGYVIPEACDSDIYTAAYLMVDGSKELNCYTEEYEEKVETVVHRIESEIKTQREQERYDEVYGEAMEEWLDGKREMEEEFAKADQEIADAEEELDDGKQELEDGRREIKDGREQIKDGREALKKQEKLAKQEFANAREEIKDGQKKLADGEKELEKAYAKLSDGQKELDQGKEQLQEQEAQAKAQFEAGYAQIEAAEQQLTKGYDTAKQAVDRLTEKIEETELALQDETISEEERQVLTATLAELSGQLEAAQEGLLQAELQVQAGKVQIEAQREELKKQEEAANAQFEAAKKELKAAQDELDEGTKQYQSGVEEIEKGKQELKDGLKELKAQEKKAYRQIEEGYHKLNEAEQELLDGEQELLDGEQELLDGEKELEENIAEYEEEKADALQELADAKKEIDDIDMTKWYVQARNALSGFSNVKSDADSIQAIGDIFPVLFLIVAILISLTTITRMVDEERGLIGTYQALGFTNKEIRRKYVIFAAASCLIGGLIGDIGGYVILPNFIFIVFHVMYLFPEYAMHFDALFGFGGILLFEVGILAATIYAVERKLRHMPATLMRPKAPKSGSRVLLERITFVWKRLSFLNKVTARNLFRYKKRMFMTIFGIMGCTALLLCGFTIKNTVSEMIPQQYENVYKYDLMVVAEMEDGEEDSEELADRMADDELVKDYISVRVDSLEIFNQAGKKEAIQLIVVPDGEMLEPYICLKDKKNNEFLLQDGDIFLTRNATRILSLADGDVIKWQNTDLVEAEVPYTKVVENYLGNVAYMTVSTYEELFGEYVANGVLAKFVGEFEDHAAYAEALEREEGILSAVSTKQMAAEFEPSFALINMVVYIVLVLAAMLAFVVLFTLSNTNISERERELATIKVLGFYDFEVHSYVNKETFILTGLGFFCGMPAGWLLGRYVMGILEFPSLEFYIALYPESYAIAAVITIVFALLVNMITDRTLNKIDMIEALKSVE